MSTIFPRTLHIEVDTNKKFIPAKRPGNYLTILYALLPKSTSTGRTKIWISFSRAAKLFKDPTNPAPRSKLVVWSAEDFFGWQRIVGVSLQKQLPICSHHQNDAKSFVKSVRGQFVDCRLGMKHENDTK